MQALGALLEGPGWAYLKSWLVHEANECVTKWTRGGGDAIESAKLASRVETLGWVMDLPETHLKDYARLLDSATTAGDEDEGGEPIVDPHEKE